MIFISYPTVSPALGTAYSKQQAFIKQLAHLFNKFLSTHQGPGMVPGTGNGVVNKTKVILPQTKMTKVKHRHASIVRTCCIEEK